MRRRLPSRRPAPRLAAAAAGRQPLWRRPLALIFRARREAAPPPAVTCRAADGARITLAPRLQLALQLWTRLGDAHHAHHAVHLDASRTVFAPVTQLFRTRHLHVRLEGPRPAGPGRAPPRTAEPERTTGTPGVGETLVVRRRVRVPHTLETVRSRTTVIRQETAQLRLRQAPRAPLDDGERASPRRAATATSPHRFLRSRSPGVTDRASEALPPIRQAAPVRLPPRASTRRPSEPPVPERAGQPTAEPGRARRATSPASLDLAPRADGRRAGAAGTRSAERPSRQVSATALDFRRPPPPVAAPEPAAAPRAAPQPQAPAIDVDAISRDVMNRIEKRLRIERERHGRI